MHKLPVVSGDDTVRAFEALGWEVARRRSSHIILVRVGNSRHFPCRTTRKLPKEHFGVSFERLD